MNRYSSRDMLALIADLNMRRILKVLDTLYRHQHGRPIRNKGQLRHAMALADPDTVQAYQVARKLDQRYRAGDMRHTDRELQQVQHLCSWLIARHAESQGGELKPYRIDPTKMYQQAPLPKEEYKSVLAAIREGVL